ncbi:IS200/IS605 family transposase [Clostridium beijerinckii]|uniref:IS200/IS605 family transposase n=1 Tax=Clostridium beijerinckii TaxID=1520 RepID=A0AAW3W3A8_CLOBE|nr:IS200/IS605 family transposase [Clostridium beijerinckii]MBC2455747.1 IS200/IS605 family transposase [Clostridium beijerinckii]MBC2473224.1 IS200/IS605 family transposase [Clostridium beijerinckii]NOV62267.1 putative transposase [Clostridium beijerinckii]NOV68236.1 putative transposase [Clostridium beijerinckii]NOW30319.1 putative transposase [Clostridium beijerinckii]
MDEYNKGSHTIYDIKYHVIWVTKYRYKVLNKPIASRLRELIRQGCEARNISIVRGSIGKDHVQMLIGCSPNIVPSKVVQYLKERLIQDEFPELKKRYWSQHLLARGYFCVTVGSVTEETIKRYIESQELSDKEDIFKIEQ